MRLTNLDHDHEHGDDHDHDHDLLFVFPGGRPPSGRFLARLALLLAAGALVLLALRTVFFVDETEYAFVTQFGKPVRFYVEPGLGIKWPYQSLWRFDRRLQMYEPPPREMLTQDKENLNFQWYVCWRLPRRAPAAQGGASSETDEAANSPLEEEEIEASVRRFLESVGTRETAESRLEERIQAAVAAEIGRTKLADLASLEPAGVQLSAIARRVTDAIRPIAAEQFGLEVVDVRIKRFGYPEAVKPAVFAEIRSERERVAVQHRAEGASQKAKIESLATLERDQILAQARREATQIRGAGEARAMEIFNAAHSRNPEFYQLLKTLETYQNILDDQTTVVLSADSPLFRLLTKGLPALGPGAKPATSTETIGGAAIGSGEEANPAPSTSASPPTRPPRTGNAASAEEGP